MKQNYFTAFLGTMLLANLTLNTAEAAVTVSVIESGGDVVFTASGTLNITELVPFSTVSGTAGAALFYYDANESLWSIGANPSGLVSVDQYTGFSRTGNALLTTDPPVLFADSGTGDRFGIDEGSGILLVPENFISGSSITGTVVYENQTLASLSISPGTRQWDWGSGLNADSVTLTATAIPEPSSAALLGLFCLSLVFMRSRH